MAYKVLLIFSNSSVKQGKANPEELKRILELANERSSLDIKIYTTFARSLSYFISNEKSVIRDHRNKLNLDEYDFVYFRKAGATMQQMLTCAYYLKDRNIPFYDQEILHNSSRNKQSQLYILARNNIRIPTSIYCRNRRRLVRLVSEKYSQYFKFPVICKAIAGSRGESNYLVNNKEELKRVITNDKKHFVVQEYIPNDGDYRFFVVNGYVTGVIHRKNNTDSHLNNVSKGASAKLISPDKFDERTRMVAMHSAQLFYRNVAGVDIMIDQNTKLPYVLEVNRAPQIEESSFVDEKADWLIKGINQAIAENQPQSQIPIKGMTLIGRFEKVDIEIGQNKYHQVIAKIDSGADSSSLHCQNIRIKDGVLKCEIGREHLKFEKFFEKQITSSNGVKQKRLLVELPIKIGENNYLCKMSLNDRSNMRREMLLGRRFLRSQGMIVDVSRRFVLSGKTI